MESNVEFQARIDLLRTMLKWICDFLIDFEPSVVRKIELSCEEALVNIINHAYKGKPEKILVEIKTYPKDRIEITFKDNGPFFDPTQHNTEPVHSSIDELVPGGLGIYFIRKNMDEIRYKRDHNENVLTLVKLVS